MKSEYTPDELLPLSGIQHFVFCRRQWALIHVEQQWKENVLTLTHRQSRFLLYVHQWPPRWWEKPFTVFGMRPMAPGEVQADFGPYFDIETLAERRFPGLIGGEAVYLMQRKI